MTRPSKTTRLLLLISGDILEGPSDIGVCLFIVGKASCSSGLSLRTASSGCG